MMMLFEIKLLFNGNRYLFVQNILRKDLSHDFKYKFNNMLTEFSSLQSYRKLPSHI